MSLIYHVDLVTRLRRAEAHLFQQIAHVIHAGVRSRVNLNEIHQPSGVERLTDLALIARALFHGSQAIDSLSQQPGQSRFPCSTRAGEEIRVVDAAQAQCIAQSAHDGFLLYHILKSLRTPLAI